MATDGTHKQEMILIKMGLAWILVLEIFRFWSKIVNSRRILTIFMVFFVLYQEWC